MNSSFSESDMKASPTVAENGPHPGIGSQIIPSPTISVIIPNYNRGVLVAETIANMLGQSLPPYEVIVVDDGSTDDSREIIGAFGKKVTLLCQTNQGPGAARNHGLLAAKGDYIQFMDSDDLASLNKLEVQAAAMDKAEADVCYGPWIKLSFDGHRVIPENHVLQTRPVPTSKTLLHWFLTDWSIVFQTCLFRREFLLDVGLYRTDMFLAEDLEYFTRILLKDPKIVFSEESLMLYRLHEINKLTESGTDDQKKILDRARHLAMAQQHCRKYHPTKNPTSNWRFRLKAWRCLEDLRQSGASLEEVQRELEKALVPGIPCAAYRLGETVIRLSGGMRQRINGSRWGRSYQPGKVARQHIRLIEELGFTLS